MCVHAQIVRQCAASGKMVVCAGSYWLYTVTGSKVRRWPVRYIARVLSFNGVVQITVISEASGSNYGVGEIERPPWEMEILEDPAGMFVPRLSALSVFVSAFDCVHSRCKILFSG